MRINYWVENAYVDEYGVNSLGIGIIAEDPVAGVFQSRWADPSEMPFNLFPLSAAAIELARNLGDELGKTPDRASIAHLRDHWNNTIRIGDERVTDAQSLGIATEKLFQRLIRSSYRGEALEHSRGTA